MVRKLDETPEVGMSMVDQIKALDEQRATLLATAKAAALEKANTAVSDLNALGFSFSLVEVEKKANGYAPKDKPCAKCNGLRFDPPHDARAHKGHPGAFSAEEAVAKGWKIIQ